MDRIQTVEEYNNLTFIFKKQHPICVCNNILMEKETREAIKKNRLWVEVSDTALVFLLDRGNIWNAYCFVSGKNGGFDFERPDDRPIIMDVIQYHREPEKCETQDKLWLSYGFVLRTEHGMYKCKLNPYDINQACLAEANEEKYISHQVLSLWNECLDNITVEVPQTERPLLENEQLLTIRNCKGDISCVLLAVITNSNALISHLVTSPEERGQGLGGNLLRYTGGFLSRQGIKTMTSWIDSSNIASQHAFKNAGFEFAGITNRQYILI